MSDEFKILSLSILAVCGLIGLLILIAYPLERAACYARWEDNKNISAVDFSFFGGCKITLKSGETLPEKNYRLLGDE